MRRTTNNLPPRRGKVLVLVALTLTVLLGMVGLTVDSGLLQTGRRQVQNAADAGALAAAMELFRGNTLDGAAALAASLIQSNNGLTDPAVTVTVQTPQGGAYLGNPNYVEVIVSAPQRAYLGPLIGGSATQTIVARAVAGFDEAIARANAAIAAGADMAFVEAPQTVEEVAAVPRLVKGPCILNVVWRGKTPEVAFADAERMGYRFAIVPGMLFKAVIGVCDATLSELRRTGRHPVPMHSMTVRDAFRRVGADDWDAISDRFGASRPPVEAAE